VFSYAKMHLRSSHRFEDIQKIITRFNLMIKTIDSHYNTNFGAEMR
jgi:hypothetical protein